MRTMCWTTLWTVTLGLTLGLTGGCGQDKVSDKDVPILRVPQVVDMMAQKGTLVVDVRKPEHYAQGHLPGAVNVYLPDIAKSHPKLTNGRQIIVYASGVTDPLSLAAAKRMTAMGYKNVLEFKGGVEAWAEAGHQLVTPATSGEVRPDSK